jgi:hypothetical protein
MEAKAKFPANLMKKTPNAQPYWIAAPDDLELISGYQTIMKIPGAHDPDFDHYFYEMFMTGHNMTVSLLFGTNLEDIFPWVNPDFYISAADSRVSVRVNPTEDSVGEYFLSTVYYELGTVEAYVLSASFMITITPDTADDASIAEEFSAQSEEYEQN